MMLISGSTYAADSILGFVSAIGIYDNGTLTVSGVANFLGSLITSKPIQQPVNAAVVLNTISTPAAGTPPSGATQITAAVSYITSCPTGSAAQVTTLPGQKQVIYNACGASYVIYPVSGGTLGALSANVAMPVDVGMVVVLDGITATQTFPTVAPNYTWNDPSVTFTIPTIAASSCSAVAIPETRARIGDRIVLTNTTSAPLNDNLTVSLIAAAYQAKSVSIKICNVAGLTASTAASATLSMMGFGAI